MSTHSEEEQIALMKDWWQRNGKPLLMGGVLALAGVFGWQAWQKHEAAQAAVAGATYQQLLELALTPQPEAAKVVELAGKLGKEQPGTIQAQYAGLFVAKLAVDTGKLEDAAAALQAIVDKPADDVVAELAQQRLARVLAAQGKFEEALAVLEKDARVSQFDAIRQELRGDLLVRLGRADDARSAYEKAKSSLSEEAAQGTLQMKLDDLAKGDA